VRHPQFETIQHYGFYVVVEGACSKTDQGNLTLRRTLVLVVHCVFL